MFSFYQIFVALFCALFVAASPVEVSPRSDDLYRRQTDWGNYVYIASITTGIIGQNLALIASPGHRAACPGEVWDIQSCADSWESECMEERFSFEWCFQHRITLATCGPEWLNMTLGCMGFSSAYCVETLITLNNCATEVTVPPPPS